MRSQCIMTFVTKSWWRWKTRRDCDKTMLDKLNATKNLGLR